MSQELMPEQGQNMVIAQSQIDMQVTTAKRYPRIIKNAMNRAEEIIGISPEIAQSCFYCLPRAQGELRGPSIRLAEIFASCWGNIQYGSRFVAYSEDGKSVIVEGAAWDLETNVRVTTEVTRSIYSSDKKLDSGKILPGKLYSQDMQVMTINAAQSIAKRNALQSVVSKSLLDDLCEKARKIAIGDLSSIGERIQFGLEYFSKLGITEQRIVGFFAKERGAFGADELEYMQGIKTAIKENMCSLDEAFSVADERLAGTTTQQKLDLLKANK